MAKADILPRSLSPEGCDIVGTQLATQRDWLKGQKIKLVPRVITAIDVVIDATATLNRVAPTGLAMITIDRAADRCIAAFDEQVEGIILSFDHADVLPLTKAESDRLEAARRLRGTSLAGGLSFLKLPHSRQWSRMKSLCASLATPEAAADVKLLGLTQEVDRINRFTALYGDQLGYTRAAGDAPLAAADARAQASQAWHDAWADLTVKVMAEYDDSRDETHQLLHDKLLAPYTTQVDRERDEDARARVRARGKDAPGKDAPVPTP